VDFVCSKKLLEVTSRLRFDHLHFPLRSEDLLVCHYLYDGMRAAGIRFVSQEIAARVSIEDEAALYGQSLDTVFGFHGKHWLARVNRAKAASQDTSSQSIASPDRVPDHNNRSKTIFPSLWGNVGRNMPCPCGSGKKFKFCHGGLI
jgi:hypothetical protein